MIATSNHFPRSSVSFFGRYLTPSLAAILCVTGTVGLPACAVAQDPIALSENRGPAVSKIKTPTNRQEAVDKRKQRREKKKQQQSKQQITKLEKYLSGATLEGHFTMLGQTGKRHAEKYTIVEAKKLKDGDLWLLKARIEYGGKDVTVPIQIQIKWADKTPVITMEKMTIIGMGTFSARVLFNSGMYSGTWSHNEIKGHLFGKVTPKGKEGSARPSLSKKLSDKTENK